MSLTHQGDRPQAPDSLGYGDPNKSHADLLPRGTQATLTALPEAWVLSEQHLRISVCVCYM